LLLRVVIIWWYSLCGCHQPCGHYNQQDSCGIKIAGIGPITILVTDTGMIGIDAPQEVLLLREELLDNLGQVKHLLTTRSG